MEKRKPNYYIYFAAVSINLIGFSTGTAYSWTSPLLPKFESDDKNINPIATPLTTFESGLLVSLINLGLLLGPFPAALLLGKIGKKMTLLITGLPLFISHILCSVASSLEVFLVARFLMGLTTGGSWSLLPGYTSEISEPRNRGVLNSLLLVGSACGGLFTFLVGPFVSIKWFSILNLVPPSMFFTCVYLFVPDSPYDLLMKNNVNAAEKSLVKLRQTNDVNKEMSEIKKIIEANSKSHAKVIDIFKNKGSSTALLISGSLMAFNALSGYTIVIGYTQTIFNLTGTAMPSAYSAIMVGSISVLTILISSQLIDRIGRKPLMIASSAITCISHTCLGIFFYLQNFGFNTKSIGWLPISSVTIFMFSFNLGLAPLPWLILGELFASNIKAVASTFCTSINFLLTFAITLVYPYLVETFGIANTFLFFGAMMAVSVIFCSIKLPETKGKSFEEIYEMLNDNVKK